MRQAAPHIVAVMNQKGGVGKTTTTVNLGHALALSGKSVLIVDLDPQGHLATALGCRGWRQGMDQVLLHGAALESVVRAARESLWLAPAGDELGAFESLSEGGVERGKRLANALRTIEDQYELVLIDCPPSSGLLCMNALIAADELLVPVSGDFLSLHGLSRLLRIVQRLETHLGRHIASRFLLTRFQMQRRHAREVRAKLESYFPDALLETAISESVALTEAPSFGKSIFDYRPTHRSAEQFRCLAQDLVDGWICPEEAGRKTA